MVNERPYSVSVKCLSKTADVFCMKADEFLRKLKPNKESWKIILENVTKKEDAVKERFMQNQNH